MDLKENAGSLYSSAFTLRIVHKSAAQLQHAIRTEGEQWQEYFPSHFIYTYFAFNSLYNIDWEESLHCGRIRNIRHYNHHSSERLTEGDKQRSYIDFCFQHTHFVSLYKDFFIRAVVKNKSIDGINRMLADIVLDSRHGNVNNVRDINNFKNAFNSFITGSLEKEVVVTIVDFICKIRNNLFHGIKTVEDMKQLGQQRRLEVYASFLVGLNQMVFSYLLHLSKGDADLKESYYRLEQELCLR